MKAEHLALSKVKKTELFDFMKGTRDIQEYKEHGLDGIRSKRKNAGRIPKISSDKNKEKVKEIISKSPRTFGYLKNTWSIRLLATYLTTILGMNVSPMQTWRIVHDLGIVSKRPKLA